MQCLRCFYFKFYFSLSTGIRKMSSEKSGHLERTANNKRHEVRGHACLNSLLNSYILHALLFHFYLVINLQHSSCKLYFQLVGWFCQKAADLDLQCFQ